MKRIVMNVLAIFFPWIVMLIEDNPGGALLTLILQATLIGWIPASIWAWQVVHKAGKEQPAPKVHEETTPEEPSEQQITSKKS